MDDFKVYYDTSGGGNPRLLAYGEKEKSLSTAFFPPKPGRCSIENPASISARLTAPATVKVAQAPAGYCFLQLP